jgi:putative NIF3 family GTP cyclohydrolase 1 type 2
MSTTPTIQAVIDLALAATPYDPTYDTVDTVKTGDPHQPVRGIATTFLASCEVIERAAAAGANLLITHEPTFYNHLDETDWLARDPVYQAKRELIDRHGLVIWRFHDFWHAHQPDGIMIGVLRALGWEAYADADSPYFCTLPATSLETLIAHLKSALGIPEVRVVGQPGALCRRVALLVGSPGGRVQIEALGRPDVDVAICGEINEWEVNEYVGDAIRLGRPKALIVTGHAPSEDAGMAYLAEWLRERLPGVPVEHMPHQPALRFA